MAKKERKYVRLFENYDVAVDWSEELAKYIETERSDLVKAGDIKKGDIDEVVAGFMRQEETDANYNDMFTFVGTHFGLEDQVIQDMLEMDEKKKLDTPPDTEIQ